MTSPHVRVEAQRPNVGHESEADITALRVLFEMHQAHRSPALSAVAFLLGVMQAVDDLGLEPTLSGHDHPSPAQRLRHMAEALPSASPAIDGNELQRLRALATDLGTFAPRIAQWLLEAPGEFRAAPVIIEDYQDDAEDAEASWAASEPNNAGDVKAAQGDFDAALGLYTQAERALQGVSYGEGQRIVYANLISTTLALGRAADALDWLIAGVDQARVHNDKPTVLYLLARFDRDSHRLPEWRKAAAARLGYLKDADILAQLARL